MDVSIYSLSFLFWWLPFSPSSSLFSPRNQKISGLGRASISHSRWSLLPSWTYIIISSLITNQLEQRDQVQWTNQRTTSCLSACGFPEECGLDAVSLGGVLVLHGEPDMVGLLSVLVLHHHLVVAGILVGQMSEMSEIFVTSSQNICGNYFDEKCWHLSFVFLYNVD